MNTQHNQGGRPAGSRNIRPTKGEIASYYEHLRLAADTGNVMAQAALIDLHERRCSDQGWSSANDRV